MQQRIQSLQAEVGQLFEENEDLQLRVHLESLLSQEAENAAKVNYQLIYCHSFYYVYKYICINFLLSEVPYRSGNSSKQTGQSCYYCQRRATRTIYSIIYIIFIKSIKHILFFLSFNSFNTLNSSTSIKIFNSNKKYNSNIKKKTYSPKTIQPSSNKYF